ncbi:MAG: RNA 2'-phosphotransferase [Pseudomonadota bacterium]
MSIKAQSKTLSYVLRHAPEAAGLILGPGGWVAVEDLLTGLAGMDVQMTEAELHQIVETNDKKRFTLSKDRTQIRAAQGHSVQIESDLKPVTPPERLYHGTAINNVDVIRAEGLKPMSRLQVHLSPDAKTARKVGERHGKPTILIVRTDAMAKDGNEFFQADNGVWLTATVPPQYLIFEGSN